MTEPCSPPLFVFQLMQNDDLPPRRAPSPRCFEGPFAEITVGEETPTVFYVHQDLICHYSSFFKSALFGEFLEASCKKVSLKEESSDIFRIIIHWLYAASRVIDEENVTTLCKVWLAADRYGMPDLQNDTINCLIYELMGFKGVSEYVELVNWVFANTTSKAKLRDVMLDAIIQDALEGDLDIDELSEASLSALARRYHRNAGVIKYSTWEDPESQRQRRKGIKCRTLLCEYHEHTTSSSRP
ncbi:MAG: hypothetical protein M1828_000741 [Chrysothrix sp. TS-e1954]|nr:MAG: hypothetical protein M1828_000741 [Chrysothrix sp. TS-e1954]